MPPPDAQAGLLSLMFCLMMPCAVPQAHGMPSLPCVRFSYAADCGSAREDGAHGNWRYGALIMNAITINFVTAAAKGQCKDER